MNVYQAIEHFDEEVGLILLVDSMFGEEGAIGGFPLPDGGDGGRQALVYDEFGLWFINQPPQGEMSEDRIRYFPFDVVTSCLLRQAEGAHRAFEKHDTSYDERTSDVLRATTLDLEIADSAFHFDGAEIADRVGNESFYPEILGDLFDLIRRCAAYGVPVELRAASAPVLVSAGLA